MPVPAQSALYDVVDCKVWSLATDLAASASPTYGTAIDVPGISAISLDPSIIANELKGDGKVLRKKARIDKFAVKATYGLLDFNVLQVILGGGITKQDSTATYYDYVLNGASASLPYFGMAVEISDTDDDTGVADAHALFYKCKLTGGTLLGQSSDSFGQPTMELDVIGPNANNGAFRTLRASLLAADTALTMY